MADEENILHGGKYKSARAECVGSYNDLVDMLPNIKCNATVFFDDTFDDRTVDKPIDNDPSSAAFYNPCTRSYWRAVREGLLKHTSCEYLGFRRLRWGKFPKGYCMGRAVAPLVCSRRSSALKVP